MSPEVNDLAVLTEAEIAGALARNAEELAALIIERFSGATILPAYYPLAEYQIALMVELRRRRGVDG